MASRESGGKRSPQAPDAPADSAEAMAHVVADAVSGVVDEVADKLARKVEEKRQQAVAKVEQKRQRAVAKVERKRRTGAGRVAPEHDERLDRLAPAAQVAYGLWARQKAATRQPRFTLDQLADAALEVVDAEGVDALSMRRLAAQLGAGTMTLYHYVQTKDELLALLADRVMAELLLDDDEFPDGWRAGMTAIARRTRDVLLAHPWVFDSTEDPTLGPNGVRHFDQSLRALASLDLTVAERLDILEAIDEYVFGYCLHARAGAAGSRGGDGMPASPEGSDGFDAMFDYLLELTATGGYPYVAALLERHGARQVWEELRTHEQDPTRFERNLARLLDSIERDLPAGATTGSAAATDAAGGRRGRAADRGRAGGARSKPKP